MKTRLFLFAIFIFVGCLRLQAQESPAELPAKIPAPSGRLTVKAMDGDTDTQAPFEIPRPAHAVQSPAKTPLGFRVSSTRTSASAPKDEEMPRAEYLLPDKDEKPSITPQNANLNLPADLEITATDTGEIILLPAGTYRQILQLPIDSPLMRTTGQTRRDQAPPVEVKKPASRYAEPEKKPMWVRYESLEKIRIGQDERRGGIDLPAHGPKELGPRVWYAKSETADLASSIFYFVFGGLGYSAANIAGWSAGNTRAIPHDFEYRLIRK